MIVEPITGLTLEVYIKYKTFTAVSSMSLYNGDNLTHDLPLFEMEVVYRRDDVDSINEIIGVKSEMYLLKVIMIGMASVCMLLIIIFSVLYLKSRKRRITALLKSQGCHTKY